MKQIINCYANWHIDIIILTGILALLLITGEAENETIIHKFIGLIILAADIAAAKKWRKEGKLKELDNITE